MQIQIAYQNEQSTRRNVQPLGVQLRKKWNGSECSYLNLWKASSYH